jgi:hypothetical protein
MRMWLFGLLLLVFFGGSQAWAESTINATGLPGNVECDAFRKNPNGSWTSIRRSVATVGNNRLSVDGTTFWKAGTQHGAVTIMSLLVPSARTI